MSWLDTLNALGVQVDALGNCQVSAANNRDTAVTITPLTHLGLFDVVGPDAEKFLQGQLSCDVQKVSAGKSLLGSHCNIKGSMISLSRLMPVEGGFWLRTERSILDAAMANLKKYMIFSKAQSQNHSDEIVGLGISGEQASALLTAQGFSIPAASGDTTIVKDGVLIRVPGDRFELWLPAAEAETLLTSLIKTASLADTDSWKLAEIRNGIPSLQTETLETFIPQMTNLQVFEGVSFSKGCYTGQEVITRLQHRGKLNRPMYRLAFTADQAPAPGTAINTPDRAGVGTVVSAAMNADTEGELLAVILKTSVDDDSTILTLENSDQPLERLTLPYALDPELFERPQRL
ncbi:folate-binding protein YgfZ [uncultured Amphritea sp.]|uniref:CAF17-like 4Fe-4S cluster assembly/insertion protein YgfZ n=1 Tax=uncultured Amphritea sp. TaxID=981605 RepID=UPI0026224A5D|nr:folate-binding protein YgfZ [uncultured Amphritea sp.]